MGWDVLMICDDISVFLFLLRLVRCVNVILLYVVVFVVVLPCLSSVSALRDTKYDLSFIVNADGNNAFADDELPATVQYKLAAFGNKTHIRYI